MVFWIQRSRQVRKEFEFALYQNLLSFPPSIIFLPLPLLIEGTYIAVRKGALLYMSNGEIADSNISQKTDCRRFFFQEDVMF